jgi:hypothetical protein
MTVNPRFLLKSLDSFVLVCCFLGFSRRPPTDSIRRPAQPIAAVADGINAKRLAVVPMVVALSASTAIEAGEQAGALKQSLPDCLGNSFVRRPRLRRLRISLVRHGNRFGRALVRAWQAESCPGAASSYRVAALTARLVEVAVDHLRHHPRFFGLAASATTVLGQFRPNIGPVVPQIFATHGTVRMLFDTNAKLAAEFLIRATRFPHVALRRLATCCEGRAVVLGKAVEVCDELVHTSILLDGNGMSTPFGDLLLGNRQ